MRAAARLLAIALGTGVLAAAGACTESTAPSGTGDNVIVDVDASAGQGDNGGGDDGSVPDDSPFARVDSAYGPAPDGYAPFDWCTQCGCPGSMFCFGGGSGYTTFNGDCHADAGALGSAPLAIGCYPFPPACANEPSCECLITAISPDMPCYPVCSITSNIVYCPHP
jgi:hypothetical protein